MNRTLAMLNVGGLFVVGILVGAFAMHLLDERRPGRPLPGDPGGGPEPPFMTRFLDELDLSEDQREHVMEILHDSRDEAEAMRREMEPRVREHIRATQEKIANVLEPEQRARFETMNERHRRRAEQFFLGRGFPPGGPPNPMGPRDGRRRPGPGPGGRRPGRRPPNPPNGD